MIKGLFRSASGMLPAIKRQETIANNVANANTAGFKKDAVFTKELSRAQRKLVPVKSDWEQPMVDEVYTNFEGGSFSRTDNPLDLAIDGDGFFTVQLPDGRTALTRSGAFSINRDGLMALADGSTLLAEGGPVEVGNGKLTVTAAGQIEVDGSAVGQVRPVTTADVGALEKIGASLFAVPEGTELIPVEHAEIRQGYVEESNVDIVREMIDMIVAFREYEANARAVTTQDQSLDNLFRRVGGDG
ncbi:MAG TPA: flagellar hook-basal body protein [candidate division Zixibacteria bacterium]|nr:flagellar hook-basal body protein [candidate division Zixibacteria bacterium]MDD4917153.1 flagellar hook-basal body protein [candidate division Zixibacteria bacterium]MDM7972663.1 flagellar hook-basal body protein [candidate division Zixibacteria bacterium]HOD65421.1 flagellar hook-basal body protein [candidate division Zixibacteria bacterium]HOZ07645.1 flagellar hook-basal body protein [candidate division Zixibacteria bacterium]